MVPADGVILEATELKLREDMLTGEADQVTKKKKNILFTAEHSLEMDMA